MPLIRYFFIALFAPFYSWIVKKIAYGPWGYVHQISIFIFKTLYRIKWDSPQKFKTLGDFFLREVPFQLAPGKLVSPVEGFCFEGPKPISLDELVSAKKIAYSWKSFQEFNAADFKSGMYWNLYLAPQNYHWVHSPADGTQLEAFRAEGAKLPVNFLGRWLSPRLYSVNERLTFKFQSKDFGTVILICVGAMGVSSLHSDKGIVEYGSWKKLQNEVKKGERLLAFKLGSTVLMLTERRPTSLHAKIVLRVGDELVPAD